MRKTKVNPLLASQPPTDLDLLGRQKVPVSLQLTTLHLLVVNLDLIGVVRAHDEGVQVGESVVLAANVFLGQQVLAFVVEDDMDFLGARSAYVRPCRESKTVE